MPRAIFQMFEAARQGDLSILMLLITVFLVFCTTFVVVFVEKGQRRIQI